MSVNTRPGFWARILGCCDGGLTSDTPQPKSQMLGGIARRGINQDELNQVIKKLSPETEGLIILLELYKLELAPMTEKFYKLVLKARKKYRSKAKKQIDKS
jgi:hypothetical protein